MINNISATVRGNKGGEFTGKTAGELSNSENESKKGGFGSLFRSMQQKEANTDEGKTLLQSGTISPKNENSTEDAETKPNGKVSISNNEQSQNQPVTENANTVEIEVLKTDSKEAPVSLESAQTQIKTGTNSTPISENLSPGTGEGDIDDNTTESGIFSKKLDISSTDGPLISRVTKVENVDTSSAGNDGIVKSSHNETGTLIADEMPTEKGNESSNPNRVVSPVPAIEPKVTQSDLLIQQNPSQQENAANASASKNVQNLPDAKNQPVAEYIAAVTSDIPKPAVDPKPETKVPVFETSSVLTETVNVKPEIVGQDSQAQVQMNGNPQGGVAATVLAQNASGTDPAMQVQVEQPDQQLTTNIDGRKFSVQGSSNIPTDTENTAQVENTREDIPAGRMADSNQAPTKRETLRSILFGNHEPRDTLPAEQRQNNSENISQENQNRLVYDVALNKSAISTLGNGVVIENMQNYIWDKRQERHNTNFETRVENTDRGVQNLTRPAGELPIEKFVASAQGLFQTGGTMSLSSDVNTLEEELMWKEQTSETFQIKDNKNVEQPSAAFGRLLEVPIYNFSVRRNLLPGLTQAVLKASSGNQAATETWQKHNFSLENGKNLQVSVRQADGIVYLKLNSSLGELHRLLLQHQDEIRDHLERECNVKVDLQFDGAEDQDLPQFFGGTDSGQKGWKEFSSYKNEKNFSEKDVQNVQKSIRKFGYNRMEWTA